jgi:RNA polymerase sigma-70 factor (ECF subfamily)
MPRPDSSSDEAERITAADLHSMGSTFRLLRKAGGGDRQALDSLVRRFRPPLWRWASGRLPRWARDLVDTEDLVQDTLVKTIRNLDHFEPRREGAFQVYLRKAVDNRIRQELKRASRRPRTSTLESERQSGVASPLEEAIGKETLEEYERAHGRLRDEEREAIVARIELGLSYAEVAETLQKPSADAARMAVSRALVRLAEEMAGEP